MAVDWDRIFKYKTHKMVKMVDARLGILNYSISVIIILYISLFVLWYKKGYLEREVAVGQVEVEVLGKTHYTLDGDVFVVDDVDITDPAIENGALFIISREEMVKQTRGTCGNPQLLCDSNADCPIDLPISKGVCKDGFCEEIGWCPPLDPSDPESKTMVRQYDDMSNLTLWIRAAISYPGLDPSITYTTMQSELPVYMTEDPTRANAFYLGELFAMAGIDKASVLQDGCFLNLRMNWDCFLDTGSGCYTPHLQATRLDVGKVSGFDILDADYVRHPSGDPAKEYRFYFKRVGIRVLIASKGTGYKVSWAAIILQFSSGIALLGLSSTIADALMLLVLPEKAHYKMYKEKTTPAFTDLRDKIADEEEEVVKLRGSAKQSRYDRLFGKRS